MQFREARRRFSCRGAESSRKSEGGCLVLAKTCFDANRQTGGFKSRQRLTRRTVSVVARQRKMSGRDARSHKVVAFCRGKWPVATVSVAPETEKWVNSRGAA